MRAWHDALRTYRRHAPRANPSETSDLMVVLCSENCVAAAVFAACEPAIVLQTFGGAHEPSDASTRSTFMDAIQGKGIRRVVVCGHIGCQAVTRNEGQDPRTAAQQHVVAQCQRLRQDVHIGALLRDHRVSLQAMWFDDAEGDLYKCDIEGRTTSLMSDEDFGRFIAGESAR